ncbi:MAG: alpha-N-acetylglucosaminidase N-terminal domain-containing protein, partial [Lentisphaeria bacterium]|nr:alpha-N-acetylglucosaminidase N-terminal domain-containing protein [Lentisphaeria bacterium]
MKILKLVVLLTISTTLFANNKQMVSSARKVIGRQIGAKATSIKISIIPKVDKCDAYTYESKGGKLSISGSSPVAISRGFYDYARSANLGMVGWRGAEFSVPNRWPDSKKVSVTTPFQFNQMYNVVTAGYTHAYWGWKRWGQELDWLALHGYNMILTPVGTEAILERVWLKLGVSQQEIDDFVCGPAHAPWQRMGNIAKTDGPLPKAWHKDQVKLQHKILKQMKALDMTPVFQGFAGFVPRGIKRLYPNETYFDTHWNGGFRNDRAPIYVLPESKLYKKIFKMYMAEFEKEFGKQKYFLIDTFNELKKLPSVPGKTTEEVMAAYGENVAGQLEEANPGAVWALQGWIFYYQRHLWSPKVVKSLFSKVPNDRMLIFDMMGVWKSYDAFYGKPWVYGMITNMGGRS